MLNEYERVKRLLKNTDPLSDDYTKLLIAMKRISLFVYFEKDTQAVPDAENVVKECQTPEPVVEPEPVTEPEPEPVKEEPAEKESTPVEYDKDTVRALLVEASQKGIQIKDILTQFVPEGKPVKFSEVPAKRYAELAEVIRNA